MLHRFADAPGHAEQRPVHCPAVGFSKNMQKPPTHMRQGASLYQKIRRKP